MKVVVRSVWGVSALVGYQHNPKPSGTRMSADGMDLFEQALAKEGIDAVHTAEQEQPSENREDGAEGKVSAADDVLVSELAADAEIGTQANSDADSDSSDSDSDADSVSSSENEVPVLEEAEEDEPSAAGPIRSLHEVVEEPVPALPEDFAIDEKTTIHDIGRIKAVFDQNVIITATISGEQRVLKEGSILCLEDKTVIGPVCEVFGPLQAPLYRVFLDKNNEKSLNLFQLLKTKISSTVFYVVPEARWIDTFELKQIKGTDASNGFDEELPENEQEFSDDEKEMEFKRKKKLAKKSKNQETSSADYGSSVVSENTSMNLIPSSSKTTTTYQPRSNRGNRDNSRNETIQENKRPKVQRPHVQAPVPTNPMQFPPGFPHQMTPPQYPNPMTYPSQQPQQFVNGNFYQQPYPPYPISQQFLHHQHPGMYQYPPQFQQQQQQQPMYPMPQNLPPQFMPINGPQIPQQYPGFNAFQHPNQQSTGNNTNGFQNQNQADRQA